MCGIKLSRNTLGDLLWFILASSSQILHSQHIWKVHVGLIDSFAIPANIDKIYTDNICSNLLKISAQNINSPITIQVCCLNHALYLPLRHGAVIQNSCHDFKRQLDCGWPLFGLPFVIWDGTFSIGDCELSIWYLCTYFTFLSSPVWTRRGKSFRPCSCRSHERPHAGSLRPCWIQDFLNLSIFAFDIFIYIGLVIATKDHARIFIPENKCLSIELNLLVLIGRHLLWQILFLLCRHVDRLDSTLHSPSSEIQKIYLVKKVFKC